MNRYAAAGIASDAAAGHRVLVVTRIHAETHAVLEQIVTHSDTQPAQVNRAKGAESITYPSGGKVRIVAARSTGHRGITADTLYLEADCDNDMTHEHRSSLIACLDGRRDSEIIRA